MKTILTTAQVLETLRGNGYAQRVADALGISDAQISLLRAGKRQPGKKMALKIAAYAGLELVLDGADFAYVARVKAPAPLKFRSAEKVEA
jgi:transcriptional regulator with XRE-family HTH domain